MRAFLFLLLALFLPHGMAAVSYWQPDASDLWWNPAESGWGVNLIMQYDTIFATFFVYAPDGRPTWYVASDMRSDGAPADQPQHFRGRLYETTGPVVTSAAFNPSAVTRRDVGEVVFEYIRPNNGTISWTVDGRTTSKQIRRQTWTAADIDGEFYLNRVLRPHLCSGPNTGNEPSVNEPGVMTVSTSGTFAVQIAVRPVAPSSLSCTYAGNRSQAGRMTTISGTYSCSDGTSGPFTLSEVQVSDWGFMSRISTNVAGCNMNGHFGGARTRVFESPS
jgi:hypothetical protein